MIASSAKKSPEEDSVLLLGSSSSICRNEKTPTALRCTNVAITNFCLHCPLQLASLRLLPPFEYSGKICWSSETESAELFEKKGDLAAERGKTLGENPLDSEKENFNGTPKKKLEENDLFGNLDENPANNISHSYGDDYRRNLIE